MRLTIPALLERHLAERPEAVAFVEGERRITYAEFDALQRNAAAWLMENGVRAGDHVAVWLVNRIEWLALLFGLARIGATLVAVNTRYRAAELEDILAESRARMLVLQLNFRQIDFPAVLADVDANKLSSLEQVIVVDAGKHPPRPVLGRATVGFDAFAASDGECPDRSGPDALALLFTTSGTTRGPKLVMHSQRTIAYHSLQVARSFGFEEPDARLLAALPFCGVFGLNATLAAFAAGSPAIIMDVFDAARAVDLVQRHAVTHAFGSDEMYRRMADAVAGRDPFPSARMFGFAIFQPGAVEFAQAAWANGFRSSVSTDRAKYKRCSRCSRIRCRSSSVSLAAGARPPKRPRCASATSTLESRTGRRERGNRDPRSQQFHRLPE